MALPKVLYIETITTCACCLLLSLHMECHDMAIFGTEPNHSDMLTDCLLTVDRDFSRVSIATSCSSHLTPILASVLH